MTRTRAPGPDLPGTPSCLRLPEQILHFLTHRLAFARATADKEQRLFGAAFDAQQGFDLMIAECPCQPGVEAQGRGHQLE